MFYSLALTVMVTFVVVAATAIVTIKLMLKKFNFNNINEVKAFLSTSQWLVTQEMIERNHIFKEEQKRNRQIAIQAQLERAAALSARDID